MIKRLVSAFALLTMAVTSAFSQSMIITGGNDHGIALCSKGQIFAWGYNNGNRLCLASPNDGLEIAPSPCLVNTGNLTFSMLSAGSGGHSVALSCYKVVYCWGANDHSQCGRASTGEKDIVSGSPIPVPCGQAPGYTEDGQPGGKYLGNVKYISATTAASMAILDDGTGRVVIWGGNLTGGGGVIETETATPVFICDAKGNPIENVIHITGGDNNILMIVGDSPDAKVGTVYSIGNWNGRGGDGDAKSYVAAPVEIGDGTGKKSSGKYLTNVRNCGIADVGAFAVDGSTGFVYGWGHGAWGCSNGLSNNTDALYAEKVLAGQYEDISNESYLTNVTQVVGGNGCGAAVTEDGYVLYWGCNDAAGGTTRSGGVIPNSTYATASSTCSTGPVFANYCAGEKGTEEVRVDDAIAIARGDLYGFIVNRDGDFYTWGSTARPGTDLPDHVGTLGVGETKLISTCFRKIEISCTPQDLCPEAFMVGPRYKCPNEADSLYCGFTPTNGSEDNYYFQWTKDGVIINTSKSTDPLATRKADKYNQPTIEITESGTYRVDIFYVGTNVPCDNCPGAFAEIEVIDMKMPIDTLIPTSCVAEPLKPSAADQINYEFTVNSNFYKTGMTTSWQVYSKKEGGDPLLDDELQVKVGANGKFIVSGDKVTANDNAPVDTTYSVWIEDVTKQEMHVLKDQTYSGTCNQDNGLIIECWSDAELKSFDMTLGSYYGSSSTEITPVIYKLVLNKDIPGHYKVGSEYARGKSVTVDFEYTPTLVTIDCGGLKLEGNSLRGSMYLLRFEASSSNFTTYAVPLETTEGLLDTSIPDDLTGKSVFALGCYEGNNAAKNTAISNVTFSKLTEYDCGRIELTSKYWCPPCNQPDGIIEIASTVEEKNDTVALCKETGSTTLSVKNIVKAAEPTATFDILWFKDPTMADADVLTNATTTASSSSLEVKWEDIPEGESQTYYLKIRDAEKPDASSCWVIDSIIVKANKVPVAPEILIDTFCGSIKLTDIAAITAKFTNLDGFDIYQFLNENGDEIKIGSIAGIAQIASELTGLSVGTHEYSLTVSDKATGCISEPVTVPIVINALPDVPVVTDLSMLKETGVSQTVEPGATAADGCTITWATVPDFSDGSKVVPQQDKSVAGTFTYYVKQSNDKTGCESDTTHFTVTVNDAPVPNANDTIICAGQAIADLSTLVTPLTSEYKLNWYASESDEKGNTITQPSVTGTEELGPHDFYVSQTSPAGAESEKKKFTVTVVGVDPANVDKAETTYCKGAEAASAETMVSLYTDEAHYYYADAMTWTLDGVAASATDLVANTDVEKSTTYTYIATQNYTIPTSSAVCTGDPVIVKVKVTVLDAPLGDLQVNYLKSDGDATQSFKNLEEQNESVYNKVAGLTAKWYDADGNELSAIPAPTYIADQDEDKEYTYYVSFTNADGCESEKSKVIVTVSSTPMPTPIHVAYCAADAVNASVGAEMTANIQTAGSDKPEDYSLVWYSSNPNDLKTAAEKAALELTEAPTAAVTITDGSTKQIYTYWVAQKKGDAVSRAIPVYDTVYAAPVLSTKTPTPVCAPATIDLTSKEIWNDAVPQNWVMAWLDEDRTSPVKNPTSISASGTFYAQAFFMVRDHACKSNLSEIKVDIHFINGLAVDAASATTTCPDNTATLKATTTEVNPSSELKYTWTCAGNGDATTVSSDSYETPALAGPAGKTYTYVLTASAGACQNVVGGSQLITIGDGPIEGTVTFTEEGNTDSRSESATANGLTFYSCGGPLTIDVSKVTSTENDFVWASGGTQVNTGSTFTIASPTNATYHLAYTNNCATGFDIKVVSVPVSAMSTNTAYDICENDNFTANVNVSCAENTYKIEWYHDGAVMSDQTGTELNFTPATTADNGVYSYKITNRGCSYTGDIAEGNALKVKPIIKVTAQTEYVARRDSQLSIPLTFTEPASGEPATIQWMEGGVNFATGNPLSLKVTADHNFTVVMQDPDYCEASANISVKKDARLQLSVSLDNQVCSGDYRDLVIDTTGTGAFVYPSSARLVLVATSSDGSEREYTGGWNKGSDGKLHYSVFPTSDTKYTVEFSYRDGESDAQFVAVSKSLKVLPPIEIEVPQGISVCADGETSQDISLTSVSPSGTLVTWDDDESIVSSREGTSTITIEPTYEEDRTTAFAYKTYYVRATYSICQEKTAYITVRLDKPLKGSIVAPEVICEGNSATIDASNYAADTYEWTSAEDETFTGASTAAITVMPTVSSTYNVDMTRGECSATDTWNLAVSSRPNIVKVDSLDYQKRDVVVGGGTSPYYFWMDKVEGEGQESSTFENLTYGKHTAYVTDEAGCSASLDFRMVAPQFIIQKVLSPNDDGVKDRFTNEVLRTAYPNAKVSIYDRWGKKLVEYKGSEEGWDGTYNGNPMPSTDYWYEIEIKELKTTYTGHFTLMRQ